jgi:hypothetical protein
LYYYNKIPEAGYLYKKRRFILLSYGSSAMEAVIKFLLPESQSGTGHHMERDKKRERVYVSILWSLSAYCLVIE